MSSDDSVSPWPASTPTPIQYQKTTEKSWVQEINSIGGQNEVIYQWNELPPSQIPVPVSASVTSTMYNGSTFNQQRFVPPNNNFNTRNEVPTKCFAPTNGMRAEENRISDPHPSLPIREFQHINNGWVIPARRFLAPRPPGNDARPAIRKPKRNRTAFTTQQLMELEQQYSVQHYLDRTRRLELAEQLHLNERTIKIWFQNRRMKEKKDKAEGLAIASSTTDELNGMQVEADEIYSGNVYVEQYPLMSSPGMATSAPMPQTVRRPIAVPTYIPEQFDLCQQQEHLQMQIYVPSHPPYQLQEIDMSPPPLVETAPVPSLVTKVSGEQNWDLSWLQSLSALDNFEDIKLS